MTIHYLNKSSYNKKPESRNFKFAQIPNKYNYKKTSTNKKNTNFFNKNITLQILSTAVLGCFCFLFIQSFLVGTTTTASASGLQSKEIQLYTNFKNDQIESTKISSQQLDEVKQTASVSSTSSLISGLKSYKLVKGDTIFDISKKTGVSLVKLIQTNNIDDNGTINVGQNLIIP